MLRTHHTRSRSLSLSQNTDILTTDRRKTQNNKPFKIQTWTRGLEWMEEIEEITPRRTGRGPRVARARARPLVTKAS